MDAGILNVLSLSLGLLAWGIPLGLLMGGKTFTKLKLLFVLMFSWTACALALCFQFIYINHMAKVGDFSAIDDTIGAITVASIVLFSITFTLNGLVLLKDHIKSRIK